MQTLCELARYVADDFSALPSLFAFRPLAVAVCSIKTAHRIMHVPAPHRFSSYDQKSTFTFQVFPTAAYNYWPIRARAIVTAYAQSAWRHLSGVRGSVPPAAPPLNLKHRSIIANC